MILHNFSRNIFFLLVSYSFFVQAVGAVEIVRLQYEYGSDTIIATGGFDILKTNRTVDLELYSDYTPITVDNFLDYVTTNAYDLSVVHRSIPDFITQSGSIINVSTPDQAIGPDTFFDVIAIGTILNEPGLPNIRGSIAMAKVAAQFVEGDTCVEEGPGCTLVVGTGPDSATSGWFVNLNDNGDSLDAANGGFTVFGSVIDDGMDTADEIAALPKLTFPGFVTDLPIADADPSPDPDVIVPDFIQANLVMILSATKINRPILRFAPAIANFGFDVPDVVVGKTIDVILRNTGDEVLDISPFSPGDISAPFSIESENCFGNSLAALADPFTATPVSSCTITLQFNPVATGVFSDDLIINYTSQAGSMLAYSVKYPLLGEGSPGVPLISTVNKLEVISQVNGFSSTEDIIISNTGLASLQISDISGLDSTGFSQTSDCKGSGVLIAPGENCVISVTFNASGLGTEVAVMTIESNDPANSSINIILTGIGLGDIDGIATAIEDAAPNAGDYNVDGIIDSIQNNVATFQSKTGEYTSLVVENGLLVANIVEIPDYQLAEMPADVTFNQGVMEYDVTTGAPGAAIEIGLVLPSGVAPSSYYLFGETADNPDPHWYKYENAAIFANSTITSSTGEQFKRSFIKIIVQDGGPGDADNDADGTITIGPAAIAYSKSSSGGALSILSPMLAAVLLLLLRRKAW